MSDPISNIACPSCGTMLPSRQLNVAADIAHCPACGTVGKLSELTPAAAEEIPDLARLSIPAGISAEQSPSGFRITATTRSAAAFIVVPFAVAWNSFILTFAGFMIGGELFLMLFLLPFVAAGLALIAGALLLVFGRQEVGADGYDGWVFTGIGPVGRTRRFLWRDVTRITEGLSEQATNTRRQSVIRLDGRPRSASGPC